MDKTYYTYCIRLTNRQRVQVEKRNANHQDCGRPDGVFRYQEKFQQMEPLLKIARDDSLDDADKARELGETLFDVLFNDTLRQDFVNFYEQVVQKENKLLRVELDIDEREMPEIAALPWEFLRVPTRANLGTIWMGTLPGLVFYRRRSKWISAKPIQLERDEKLKIALVVSAPPNLKPVAYERVQKILEKLAEEQVNRIELLPIVNSANPEEIYTILLKKPHIFHFIGHGRLIKKGDREVGEIALVDRDFDEAMWVDADYFSGLFAGNRPSVVMLQACEGGKLSDSQAFTGVASGIIQQNIPVVVAMQYKVTNSTASRFARCFYQQLAEYKPVDIAAQEGRLAITLGPTQYRKRDFATPVIFMGVEDGYLFKKEQSSVISTAVEDGYLFKSQEATKSPSFVFEGDNLSKNAVSNMQMLAKDPSLRDEQACMILDAAIDNLNESDSWNGKLNTPMDEAFDAVMQSRFSKLCHDRLLQGYIQARDLHRITIGVVFASRAITDSRILNADNATWILEPLLQKLFMGHSIEERVDAALQLVEAFFRPQSKSSTRIDFLPHKLLRTTVNVLLTAVEDETASNDAVTTAAIWALSWLTNTKASNPYTVYKFTEGELDSLRRIARNKKRDAFARSYTALILSICNSEKTVFAQADWIHEWALVADGAKPQRQLPVMTPINRPKDVNIFKDLICSDLPTKAKRSVALALGRLGCLMSEMVEPLLQIFQNERSTWEERDEALVYLVLIGGHQVISVLKQEASSPFENDKKKYNLPWCCFLALVGMGDVDALEYLLDLGGEQSVVDAYAYALAGVADPRGREILEHMKNHSKNRVRSAVAKALELSKNTDFGSVASGFENFFGRNLLSRLNEWNFLGGQSNKSSLSNNNSTTITDRMISKQGHLVHKLKAKDSTGRWAYYFVYVNPNSEQAFLEALNSDKSFDLEEYGTVIGSCYGEKPNQKLRDLLKEKYGFDV